MQNENLLDIIKFKKGRYQIMLPFRELDPITNDILESSRTPVKRLVKQLKWPCLLESYDQIIKSQLVERIIEPVNTLRESDF